MRARAQTDKALEGISSLKGTAKKSYKYAKATYKNATPVKPKLGVNTSVSEEEASPTSRTTPSSSVSSPDSASTGASTTTGGTPGSASTSSSGGAFKPASTTKAKARTAPGCSRGATYSNSTKSSRARANPSNIGSNRSNSTKPKSNRKVVKSQVPTSPSNLDQHHPNVLELQELFEKKDPEAKHVLEKGDVVEIRGTDANWTGRRGLVCGFQKNHYVYVLLGREWNFDVIHSKVLDLKNASGGEASGSEKRAAATHPQKGILKKKHVKVLMKVTLDESGNEVLSAPTNLTA